jgi:dihydrofolate reductase
MLAIVVAVADNGVIGYNNDLPWHLRADLKHFKEVTDGHPVIMGRKTYESIVARLGHGLPNRLNIVLTSHQSVEGDAKTAASLTEAIALAGKNAYVIGGASVFSEALLSADTIYLTEVHAKPQGDTYLPAFNKADWQETERESHHADEQNDHDFEFVTLKRKTASGYNLTTARSEAQRSQMAGLMQRGVCNFCPEHIESEQKEPIELRTDHWVVKKNDYPYVGTKVHLLLIPREHVLTFSKLSKAAQRDFSNTITKAEQQWSLSSYALGMRSGDVRFNGGSVEHLHAHIVVGDTSDLQHEPVRFKMSSRPTSET